MIITARPLGRQPCWSDPWTRFSARTASDNCAEAHAIKPQPTRRLLHSVEEAANLLGIGRTFMLQLVATGEIDSFKVGKHRKIPVGALYMYIERLRDEQAAAARGAPSGGQPPDGMRGGVQPDPRKQSR
jgi:excisionase family DNA binding protein